MESLYNYISKQMNLSQEAKEFIASISKVSFFEKDTVLLNQGESVKKTYFVIDGCVRSFLEHENGKEHTLQFAIKDWWISDFMGLFNHEVSSLTIECITDTTLVEFNLSDIEKIYTLFPEFEAFQRKNLERHINNLQKRILNLLHLTANERYSNFLKQFPDVEKYAHNYHIASYLGITQQSLSRIRSEKKL